MVEDVEEGIVQQNEEQILKIRELEDQTIQLNTEKAGIVQQLEEQILKIRELEATEDNSADDKIVIDRLNDHITAAKKKAVQLTVSCSVCISVLMIYKLKKHVTNTLSKS